MLASPLSSTVAPLRCAAERAHSRRRAATSSAGRPSRRPSSPSCGVSTVGAGTPGEQLRPVAERVQPVGVEQERAVDAEELAHQLLRLVGAAQAGADGDGLQARRLCRAARRARPSRTARRAPGTSTRDDLRDTAWARRAPVRGRATCTRPAPERSAAIAAMWAAPVMPREPPTTSSVPTERLWSSGALGHDQLADRLLAQQPHVGVVVAAAPGCRWARRRPRRNVHRPG